MQRKHRWIIAAIGVLAALALAACGGELPTNLPSEFELEGEQVEFTGVVEAIADTSWTVSGITLSVDGTTEIKGTIELGDPVKVHARLVAGELLAQEIELAEPGEAGDEDDDDGVAGEFEFTGTVDQISSESWTVSGTELAITPQTEIKGDPAVGDLVKVHAFEDDLGVLTAREIEPAEADDDDDDDLDDLEDDENEIVGILESVDGDTWVVAGTAFLVTESTEIEDEIQIGDLVKVEFSEDPTGGLVANEIELADDDDLEDHEDELDDDEHDDDEDEDDDDHGDDHEEDEDDEDEDRSGSNSGSG